MDRIHEDDFDYEGAEWIDVTVIGSRWEEQLDSRSAHDMMRHRPYFEPTTPWKRGPAPKDASDA
jgi:hypothetical protein